MCVFAADGLGVCVLMLVQGGGGLVGLLVGLF